MYFSAGHLENINKADFSNCVTLTQSIFELFILFRYFKFLKTENRSVKNCRGTDALPGRGKYSRFYCTYVCGFTSHLMRVAQVAKCP